MSEKYVQYHDLRNDKSLISQNTPTENDLTIFKEWLIHKREQFKKSAITITIIFLVFLYLGISMHNFWGVIFILLFGLLEVSILKDYFGSKNWIPEYVDYGEVIDKYVKYERKDDKDHYIIVRTDSCDLRYKMKGEDYKTFFPNNEVIIFAISGRQETFISKKK